MTTQFLNEAFNSTPAVNFVDETDSGAANIFFHMGDHNHSNYFQDIRFEANVSDTANVSVNNNNYYYGYDNYYSQYFYDYYLPTPAVTTIVLVILGIILLVGIVGNILVMIIIAAVKSMHTTVNKCLFSLALADLVILCLLPILPITVEITDDTTPLSTDFCNFLNMYDRGARVCSVLIFLYVTIDRYFALCYPLKSRALWTGRKTYMILVLLWVVSLAFSYPYCYSSIYEEEVYQNVTYYYCSYGVSPWMIWYDTFFNVIIYYINVPIYVILYGKMICRIRASVPKTSTGKKGDDVIGRRGRGQVVVLLLAVVIIYILTQLPFGTLSFFTDFIPELFSFRPFDERAFAVAWTCRLLMYVNSAANPVIYFSLSTNFRQGFLQVFCFGKKDSQKQSQITQSSSIQGE